MEAPAPHRAGEVEPRRLQVGWHVRYLRKNYIPHGVGAVLILVILVVAHHARSARLPINQEPKRKPNGSLVSEKALEPSSSTSASRLPQSEAETQPSSEQAAKETASYKLAWGGKVAKGRDDWARRHLLKSRTINHEQVMNELMRIMSLSDETEKAEALEKLLPCQRINLELTQLLLTLYDQQKPGEVRYALFASMVFSSEESYLSEQMLLRAHGQPADEREYQLLAVLPGKQEEIWRLLCDSAPQCTTASSAREATIAISQMVDSYGIESGPRVFASHMDGLIRQIRWPNAREYVYLAMTRHPAPAMYEHFNAAVTQETDEELKKYASQLQRTYFKRR